MNRLLSIIKISTFTNVKIFAIFSLILLSIFFGFRYIENAGEEEKQLMENINTNIYDVMYDNINNNKLFELDNRVLSKSLDREMKYDSLSQDIEQMKEYVDNISDVDTEYIDSILIKKKETFELIIHFDEDIVNIDKVRRNKKVEIISSNKTKGIFKTKTEYDTIIRNYSTIDEDKYIKENNKILLSNSNRLNDLIRTNNELTLCMKLSIDSLNIERSIINFEENKEIINKLSELSIKYIIILLSILSFIIILIYLLIIDIRRIKNSDKRAKNTIDILIRDKKR